MQVLRSIQTDVNNIMKRYRLIVDDSDDLEFNTYVKNIKYQTKLRWRQSLMWSTAYDITLVQDDILYLKLKFKNLTMWYEE